MPTKNNLKKYSVCVQVWGKPAGLRTFHKMGVFYIPYEAASKLQARRFVNSGLAELCTHDFRFTVKFANKFNPSHHK